MIRDLDPGIRETVARLRAAGFDTTDSGDGVSKVEAIACGEALAFPHVACVTDQQRLFDEAARMLRVLGDGWNVEASYNPADRTCVLFASLDVPR